jgi:hypothetical protein
VLRHVRQYAAISADLKRRIERLRVVEDEVEQAVIIEVCEKDATGCRHILSGRFNRKD